MPDFAIDYVALRGVRDHLYRLADQVGPKYMESELYQEVPADNAGDNPFGDEDLLHAVNVFLGMTAVPMRQAGEQLRKLGDVFGGVANSLMDMDSEWASGLGVMGGELGLSDWRGKRAAYDQWVKQKADYDAWAAAHPDLVRDGMRPAGAPANPGQMPPNPGPPPVDFRVDTAHGSVSTHLTLDGNHNVIKEESKVTVGNQTYTSVTAYNPGGSGYVTDTTYADGSSTHSVVTVNSDQSERMVVTSSDGETVNYVKDRPGQQWRKLEADPNQGDDDVVLPRNTGNGYRDWL